MHSHSTTDAVQAEAKLWKATWKQVGQKYSLSLVDHPKIKVSGEVLDDAIEKLEDLVADELGDPVPHFEFITPLPTEQAGVGNPYIHILTGHKCAENISNMDRLFVKAKCPKCWNFSGPRTEELIRLASVPDGDLIFTDFLGQIISAQLAAFLKLHGSEEIALRPIILCGRETTDFLELRSSHPREYVAIKGVKASKGGFKCGVCGFVVWMYMPYEAQYSKYVLHESLASSAVFPIGINDQMRLAVSKQMRASVIRSSQFKNVVSRKIGVLTKEQAVPIASFFEARTVG
jgi:hypothetical protein